MSIKKAPITKAYNVNLYCDKCGEIMHYKKNTFKDNDNKVQFLYRCSCGHEEISDNMYPYQIIEFDKSQEEVIR